MRVAHLRLMLAFDPLFCTSIIIGRCIMPVSPPCIRATIIEIIGYLLLVASGDRLWDGHATLAALYVATQRGAALDAQWHASSSCLYSLSSSPKTPWAVFLTGSGMAVATGPLARAWICGIGWSSAAER